MVVRVVLCPDSFKGSLDAPSVAVAMADGVRSVCPDAVIDQLPMADGGEGTAEVLTRAVHGEWRETPVQAPNGKPVTARWGWLASHRLAMVEVATACGLHLLPEVARDPWRLDTYGLGTLIRAALDAGAERILVGLGGSGTNDAGAGLLAALGMRFLDDMRRPLPANPAGLSPLVSVDVSGLDPRLDNVSLVMLSDVDVPLTGPDGASATFGPQKGLDPADIAAMDARINDIARKLAQARPLFCTQNSPGMGAAGGVGFALAAVLGAERQMGSHYVAELIGMDQAIAAADLVITGEGRLDDQTVRGKVIAEVLSHAVRSKCPAIAIAGNVACTDGELRAMGLHAAYSLCSDQISMAKAMAQSRSLIAQRTADAVRNWLADGGYGERVLR